MLSLSVVLALAALILVLIDMTRSKELRSSLVLWAVLLICLALLSPLILR